ncbi:MAG: 4-hydroxythreonine-4-phosphate dehydrogenase PdxA [Gammaproteobacteria bacterium]|nr:4-hydroxythreonine-4-phosphate dehydrogenase PdxA [Gammaproteobacteria bacterium]MDH5652453.1 4-hydroxythreonine-4-phosphate dehydrogenase PdxA [Gammaproteobacteria bacterium]
MQPDLSVMTDPVSRLLITPGEPAGIGADLLLRIAARPCPAQLVAVASKALLEQRAAELGITLQIDRFDPSQPRQHHTPGRLPVLDIPLQKPVTAGKLDTENAAYVLRTLDEATALCQSGQADALVTGPVHKGIINAAGIPFTGHTEYLAELSKTPMVVMMLACPGLRVALVTTHLPLAEVSRQITPERLTTIIRILQHDLQQRFAIPHPAILVCGLNPHAGEDGHLGREEIEVISPVLRQLNAEGMQLIGPLSADTLFIPTNLSRADAVLAMYHDQGLPVLKHMGFGKAINITLGLPFIRTSVDHGTALELAGKGTADTGSLECAITTALEMAAKSRSPNPEPVMP